jgi:RNA polymerase sigma-70 factor, ECF subfamily
VALLDSLLAKMSEEQREVFVLHELEHLSGSEIAELTCANENTVWTRLRAARRIFQEGVARQHARGAREQT